ncbi:MAG: NAD(P)H-dependent oxidoreductase [Dehalococcoidia bacterium]|nr:NAD(P)H-dependent oxidoreductase [Dehalococcoidia bacterium]MDD5493862.1 NAD(P)H-dependent oxidoreductase [Dehalococcoidia bacterium]
MKVMALNSSPRVTGQSKTEMLLTSLVKGMRDAGAEVTVVNLRQKKVNRCLGCYTCWTKTPGVCVHKDDMALELYPQWLESDIAVYASPLYYYTFNAEMKAFMERTLPVLTPQLRNKGEVTSHDLRGGHPAVVSVSTAGFPEESVFDALSYWLKKLYGPVLLAEIYRPAGETLAYSSKKDDVLDAMEQAGRELITGKKVSQETMQRIKQPIADPAVIAAMANIAWQSLIDKKLAPAEADRQGKYAMRPDSIEVMMTMLAFAFDPRKIEGRKGTLQFNLSGARPGSFYLATDGVVCIPKQGQAVKADCTVNGPFEVWADIIEGKADGAKMMMEGRYKVEGDLSLIMCFGQS